MAWPVNKGKKDNRWGDPGRDYQWQQGEEPQYMWLKKFVAAALIFIIVYIAHTSDTSVGRAVTGGVKYIMTVETDWGYLAEQVAPYAPQGFDTTVLKRVQTVISKPADPLQYMIRPVDGKIMAPYGWRTHPVLKQEMLHEGIDFEAAPGTNVSSAAPGTVKSISDSAHLGKTVIVEHSRQVETVYGHLQEVLVKQGDPISQGQIIGKSGKTGMVAAPLLYFEVREQGKAVDPMTRLKGDSPAARQGK